MMPVFSVGLLTTMARVPVSGNTCNEPKKTIAGKVRLTPATSLSWDTG
jgi:hypothetical protein